MCFDKIGLEMALWHVQSKGEGSGMSTVTGRKRKEVERGICSSLLFCSNGH